MGLMFRVEAWRWKVEMGKKLRFGDGRSISSGLKMRWWTYDETILELSFMKQLCFGLNPMYVQWTFASRRKAWTGCVIDQIAYHARSMIERNSQTTEIGMSPSSTHDLLGLSPSLHSINKLFHIMSFLNDFLAFIVLNSISIFEQFIIDLQPYFTCQSSLLPQHLSLMNIEFS
jgi:hypothetical protein